MSQESNKLATDLRGAAGLTIDAIIGVTNMVESLHNTIAGGSGERDGSDQIRTKGIPGFVYRNIRAVTQLSGIGIDVLLKQTDSLFGEISTPGREAPGREAVLAALNGTLGDYLVAKNNPLAILMQFRRNGNPMNEQALAEEIQNSNGRVVIMLHGSCMNDMQWKRRGHDHGAALARDLGIVPIYVHYNSGLHISENGRMFADLLEKLSAQAVQPLDITLIGYSMGGLVSRSAFYYGQLAGHSWLKQLRKLMFLGTPHHGALLEKGGNWIDTILGVSAYSAPFSRLGKIRSSGLTDLRYGNVVEGDWKGRDRFKFSGDERIPVPLPDGVQCYAIAATTAIAPDKFGDDLVGDGLVTVSSALGRHERAELTLSFAEDRKWIGRNMNHLDLLNYSEVYATIKKWVESE